MTTPAAPATTHEPLEEYAGPAQVRAEPGDATAGPGLDVRVHLRGRFEPIDGRFHWWGRLEPADALGQQHRSGDRVLLRTPYGEATCRLSDVDPWGRFRVTGTGRPPF